MTQYVISHGRMQSDFELLAHEKRRKRRERRQERDLERGERRPGSLRALEHFRTGTIAIGDKAQVDTKQRRLLEGNAAVISVGILAAATVLLLIILIPVGVLVIGKKNAIAASATVNGLGKGEQSGSLANINPSTIPSADKGTYYDPFTWLDTTDFNLTYTRQLVGGLPVMGLWDNYDDTVQANENVPPLNEAFPYGTQPFRGVNLGGWLVVEPFITPSFFSEWDPRLGVVDEFTLSKQLGPTEAAETLEKHYSTFINADTFRQIRDAGLDHVRIPYGYWAVLTLPGDSFVPMISWRYLLRAIEYARKYGLRVNLDLHSVPGNANGWNHSGRIGPIGWLNGTDGDANAQKTLDIHSQLATFFSQPRYKNVVTLYGLVNEPKMIVLDAQRVIKWTEEAYSVVRNAGYEGKIIFGDGFRGLETWQGTFTNLEGMLLDVHQYVIFNVGQLATTHSEKITFACQGWGEQMLNSLNTSSGFGPTMVGEWGQAETDCTLYLNNVGVGSRWEGTLNTTDPTTEWLKPTCPNGIGCSCEEANADPSTYSDEYRQFLKTFAEAQMDSFEKGWGWMYWTWDTEAAQQWSYKKGLVAGILPPKAYKRDFTCQDAVPDFFNLGLPEYY
ncbi:hypothetical protein RUND412_011257 [Rhizina undulata]